MFLCLVHSTARAIPRLGGSMKYPVCFLPMKRDIHNKSDIIKWFKALNCLFCPKLPPHLIFFFLLLSGSDGTFPHYVGKSVLSLTSFHLPFFPPPFSLQWSKLTIPCCSHTPLWTGITTLTTFGPFLPDAKYLCSSTDDLNCVAWVLMAELAHVEEAFALPIGCNPTWTGVEDLICLDFEEMWTYQSRSYLEIKRNDHPLSKYPVDTTWRGASL